MSTTTVITLTAIGAGAFFLVGGAFLYFGEGDTRQSLGGPLVTGAAVTFAIFALQLYTNQSTEKQKDERAQELQQETYRIGLAQSSNLTGFDPGQHSIAGMYLGQKVLDGALFTSKDLHGATLQGSRLRDAHMERANLERANLLAADLFQSDLTGANLKRTDLRFAKFENAAIESVASFKGAQVNYETCWPAGFLNASTTRRLVRGLVPTETSTPDGKRRPKSRGHTCRPGEHKHSGPQ